ncbi:MAG: exodeoxyribonuclease VII large subunit [Bacteroidales bacterium]|nr:exodeoxyribonuclease VII large subunit [Bacteroidales bacterium]
MRRSYGLYEFNALIRDRLEDAFPETYWVRAEIAECKPNSSGHCYLELIEKGSGDRLTARMRAVIWANVWFPLSLQFEQATGSPLMAGQKILAEVSVGFHELYGLSLTITDIDPDYTLGEWALRRREILRRLEEDGVLEMNRELPEPLLPQRLAVISSEKAAGYEDFVHQLSSGGYAFYLKLFPAIVQGNQAEESILAALDRILEHVDLFDMVVLIRGGGASADLSCFDSYELCSALAQFPLPVLVGVGHERDKSVADVVAHVSVKTPTAAAAWLIDRMAARQEDLEACSARLEASVREVHRRLDRQWQLVAERCRRVTDTFCQGQRLKLQASQLRLRQKTEAGLADGGRRLDMIQEILKRQSRQLLMQAQHRLDLAEKDIEAVSPRRQLERGYSMTLYQGRLLRSAKGLPKGSVLETRLADGILISKTVEDGKENL